MEFVPIVSDDNVAQYCRDDVELEVIPNVDVDINIVMDYNKDVEAEDEAIWCSDFDDGIDNDMDYSTDDDRDKNDDMDYSLDL